MYVFLQYLSHGKFLHNFFLVQNCMPFYLGKTLKALTWFFFVSELDPIMFLRGKKKN